MVLTQKSPLVVPRNQIPPSKKDEKRIKKEEPAYEVEKRLYGGNNYLLTFIIFRADIATARQGEMPDRSQRHTRRRSHSDREAPHPHARHSLQVGYCASKSVFPTRIGSS